MYQFTETPGSIILCSKGVFTEVLLSSLNGEVYAKTSRGHIRIKANGATSLSNTFWTSISWDTELTYDKSTGYLQVPTKRKPPAQILAA